MLWTVQEPTSVPSTGYHALRVLFQSLRAIRDPAVGKPGKLPLGLQLRPVAYAWLTYHLYAHGMSTPERDVCQKRGGRAGELSLPYKIQQRVLVGKVGDIVFAAGSFLGSPYDE